MTIKISRQIFAKSSKTKFHETPSSESRIVPRRRTDIRGDITKLIVAFWQFFANAPKKCSIILCLTLQRVRGGPFP